MAKKKILLGRPVKYIQVALFNINVLLYMKGWKEKKNNSIDDVIYEKYNK